MEWRYITLLAEDLMVLIDSLFVPTCSTDKTSCCCVSHRRPSLLYICTSYLSPSAWLSWRKPCRSSSRHPRSACGPRPGPRTPCSCQQAAGKRGLSWLTFALSVLIGLITLIVLLFLFFIQEMPTDLIILVLHYWSRISKICTTEIGERTKPFWIMSVRVNWMIINACNSAGTTSGLMIIEKKSSRPEYQ